eukprot:Partr_v1_DN28793_c0_g1_i2_m62112
MLNHFHLGGPSLWSVSGTIIGAFKSKGVRAQLYQFAAKHLGYYEKDKNAFDYIDSDLIMQVIFKKENAALRFENEIIDAGVTIGPFIGLASHTLVEEVTYAKLGLRILTNHYDIEEFSDTDSVFSGTASTSDIDSDQFKYQRIEKESLFYLSHGLESCHLMSSSYCKIISSCNKYDNDPSNRLVLSRDMHGYLDALSPLDRTKCAPLFCFNYLKCSKDPVIGMRYEVTIQIEAVDQHCANLIFHRLNDGADITGELTRDVKVYVLNPEVFKVCCNWKEREIRTRWNIYNNRMARTG